MPKVRNISGEARTALGRLVLEGGVLDVPAADVYGFTQQPLWEPVDAGAQAAHEAAHAAYLEALEADGQRVPIIGEQGPELVDLPAGTKVPAVKRGTKKES